MYLSIQTMNDARPSVATRRAKALVMVRDMLDSSVQIGHYDSGEPYLIGVSDYHLSISHSGPWLACLLSPRGAKAAIDLEQLSPRRFMALAKNYFSPPEIDYVRHHGLRGFYQLWTTREAIAKVQSQGLATALNAQIDVVGDKITSDRFVLQTVEGDGYLYTIASVSV